jgi:hypothetical protein
MSQEIVSEDTTGEEIPEQKELPEESPEPEKPEIKGKEGEYGQMELEF